MAALVRVLPFPPQGMVLAARRGIPMLDLLAGFLGDALPPVSAGPLAILSSNLAPLGSFSSPLAGFMKQQIPAPTSSGVTSIETEGFGATAYEFLSSMLPICCLSGATQIGMDGCVGAVAPCSRIQSPMVTFAANLSEFNWASSKHLAGLVKQLIPASSSGVTRLETEGFGATAHEFLSSMLPTFYLSGATQLGMEGFVSGVAPCSGIQNPKITFSAIPMENNWSWTASSKVNMLCLGASAGLLLFSTHQSKESPPIPPPEHTPTPPGGGGGDKRRDDWYETVLRLLNEMYKILQDMALKELKKPMWFVELLEKHFGEAAAANLIYLANLLKNQWDKFYILGLIALPLFSLQITPLQGLKILRFYLLEEQEEFQKVLAAYARNAEKKDCDDEAVSAVSFCVVNLETHELSQISLFMRGVEGAAVLSLLREWSMSQPKVTEGVQLNQILLFLTSENCAAVLQRLQSLSNGVPTVESPSE